MSREEIKSCLMRVLRLRADGDGVLLLWCAVIDQAIKDAREGKLSAKSFLFDDRWPAPVTMDDICDALKLDTGWVRNRVQAAITGRLPQ